MRPLLPVLTALLWLPACGKNSEPAEAAGSPLIVLERAWARPTPNPVRARLNLKLRSPTLDLRAGTGAVWIADRPGQGHLAILGPLGGPLATITSDGEALAVAIPRDGRLLEAPLAESVLRQTTGDLVGLDDLVGLMLGDIPFDTARIKSRRPLPDGTVQAVLQGPERTRLELVLDALTATPVSLDLTDREGRQLLTAAFEPFEERDDGTWVPTRVQLYVPHADLQLDIRYKSWELLDEVPPVFSTEAPEGWTTEPLGSTLLPVLGGPELEPTGLASPPPDGHP